MSLRTDLERLDATYRAGLSRRQLGVSLAVDALFKKLTIADILAGTPAVDDWLDKSTTIAMAVRGKIADETATYFTDLSRLTLPGARPISTVIAEPPPLEQIRTSLWVTGVVSARKRIDATYAAAPEAFRPSTAAGAPPLALGSANSLLEQAFLRRAADPEAPQPQRERALQIIESGRQSSLQEEAAKSGEMAGAAAARHAVNVSRDSAIETAKADRRVIGWVRVTSGRPCFFCAALASRGPVYQDDSFDESDPRFEGPGQHKVHDHCSGSLRPVTSRSHEEWPEASQEYEARWKALSDQTNLDHGRNPTMLDWRRAFTAA
jgi:hypothetical protein